jgi:hypothetical protein
MLLHIASAAHVARAAGGRLAGDGIASRKGRAEPWRDVVERSYGPGGQPHLNAATRLSCGTSWFADVVSLSSCHRLA